MISVPPAKANSINTSPRYWVIALSLLFSALLLITLVPFITNPLKDFNYYGRYIPHAAPDFTLKNTHQQHVSLQDYRGKFVYLMFGYIGCDELCHSQVLTLFGLDQRLASEPVEFLYLGMDPEKDTAQTLRHYFDNRSQRFTGLIADSMPEAQRIAADYHAYFHLEPGNGDGLRRINHPGFIYLIDPEGLLQLAYSGSFLDIERMISDFNHISTRVS